MPDYWTEIVARRSDIETELQHRTAALMYADLRLGQTPFGLASYFAGLLYSKDAGHFKSHQDITFRRPLKREILMRQRHNKVTAQQKEDFASNQFQLCIQHKQFGVECMLHAGTTLYGKDTYKEHDRLVTQTGLRDHQIKNIIRYFNGISFVTQPRIRQSLLDWQEFCATDADTSLKAKTRLIAAAETRDIFNTQTMDYMHDPADDDILPPDDDDGYDDDPVMPINPRPRLEYA